MSATTGSAAPKSSLGTVVECAESADDAPTLTADTAKSRPTRGKEDSRRRTLGGSRLSLASLFSFSSQGRDRSRSGWSSGGDEVTTSGANTTGRAMSVSTSDLRSPNSSNKRAVMESEEVVHLDEACGEDEECAKAFANGIRRNCKMRECPLCYLRQPLHNFPKLSCCSHRSCRFCLMQYVELEIMENRVEVSCPECSEHLHPSDVHLLLGNHTELMEKYENFSLRRYLMTEPDTRWCPAPDCTYAVIATACAACPQLRCEREECGTLFCYHCKGVWHANQTCDEARRQRAPNVFRQRISALGSIDASLKPGDIKACPRCRTYIVKMDDGSCNHMVCAMCSAEFCWLCLKEISDLHYLSPTGCTFWGKKPWTRKKKLLWQLGTLVGAPVGIALIAGLSIPGIIFGVPVFVGRKVHQRFIHHTKVRRRLVTAACVAGSLIVSPVLAVMAVGVGVPIMLAYVYGVVPLSLCRNGGCGLSDSGNNSAADGADDEEMWNMANVFMGDGMEKSQLLTDAERVEATSLMAGLSVNSGLSNTMTGGRLSVVADTAHRRRHSVESGVTSLGDRINYEEASTKAMAGSHYYDDKSVHTVCSGVEAVSYCDEVASTKALAGSVLDSKSLSDSLGGRVHFSTTHQVAETPAEDKPCSSHAFDEPSYSGDEHPNVSMHYRKRNICRQACSSSSSHHNGNDGEDGEEVLLMSAEAAAELEIPDGSDGVTFASAANEDPYRIRALFDTMKQMVAVEDNSRNSNALVSTPHNVLDGLPARSSRLPLRRTGSARTIALVRERGDGASVVQEEVRMAAASQSSIDSSSRAAKPATKRRFFGLFSKK